MLSLLRLHTRVRRNFYQNLPANREFSSKVFKVLYAMRNVYFRHTPETGQLDISFRYTNAELNIDRDFNFSRNVNENVEICLNRIKNNIEKELNKKSKKKKKPKKGQEAEVVEQVAQAEPEILVQLLKSDNLVSEVTFSELIKELANVKLRIFNDDFEILFNTPWVASLGLPSSLLSGFVVYPNKVDILFGTRSASKGIWYRGKMPASNDAKHVEWVESGQGLTYETSTADVGHFLKFELIPGNGETYGPSVEAVSKCAVQAGPGRCPFEDRLVFTQSKLCGDKFRVMSYNILADLYADSDYTRAVLFPYCPPYALAIDYRKQLFTKEIVGYNSDIICLQEVDNKVFDYDLTPVLEAEFDGTMQQKGKSGEGVATFYRCSRFELVSNHGINIGESIAKLEIFSDLWNKIKSNEKLVERIVPRSTALQVTVLKSKDTNNVLVVANTHLYFHPDADHIRLLQIAFSTLFLNDVVERTAKDLAIDRSRVSVVFCGDFNSVPECGIYKLLTEKFVPEDFVDWSSNKEEAVKNVSLSQPLNMQSACGTPEYTNYTHSFAACLDYIFYETDNLAVEEVIPLPSEEELKTHVAIPSVVFPSDHVALVANLKFKTS